MLSPSITVRDSQIAGKGLFTVKLIQRDEVVWRLATSEPKLSYEELQKLSEHERSLAFQFADKYIICHEGSEYMNHSCDPNTWWISDTELAARRDIKPGEEITYDYVTADVYPLWTASWQCRCGSTFCRYTVTSEDYKSKQWQEHYKGHLPSWVVEAIAADYLAKQQT